VKCALKRHSKQTPACTPFSRIAARTRSQSASESAIGFSIKRCFFARAAAIACSACKGCGVQMSMTSISGSASILQVLIRSQRYSASFERRRSCFWRGTRGHARPVHLAKRLDVRPGDPAQPDDADSELAHALLPRSIGATCSGTIAARVLPPPNES
jgi:hypothetical protein